MAAARRSLLWLVVLAGVASLAACGDPAAQTARREKVLVTSSIDGSAQPSYLTLPPGFDPRGAPVPLLVSLHSWSGDLEQRHPELEAEAARRGWIYLFPNFRGANDHPDACGSETAQQDILDAVAWVRDRYPVDAARIYLTGSSGGGHMTMLMAGRHPGPWAAASAWVGISDLAAWHRKHAGARYGRMLEQCTGGAPGSSPEADSQYRARSPLTWLAAAASVPLDLAAGIHDGHTGSVPVRHTLEAFNAVAAAAGAEGVSEAEIAELSRPDGRLSRPRPSDRVEDAAFQRAIHLRREAAQARVTIFEGGHEGLPLAAAEWLSRHRK